MRLAIWNTAFLGDAVLTLPLVLAIRRAWPQAGLDLYVRRGLGELFSAQSSLDNVYEIGRAERSFAGAIRLWRQVARRGYDVWIGAHLSLRSSLVACAGAAPIRIGYAGAGHRRLAYTRLVERRFGALDEIERLLELSRPLGDLAPGSDTRLAAREWKRRGAMSPEGEGAPGRENWPARWPEVWPELDLLPADEEAAAAFRASLPPGPVLGIHPGSAWGSKRWTDEGFAVVARLAADAGANVLLFAGPGEESGVAGILRLAGLAEESPRIRNLAGRLGLIRLAAFLRLLDCFLVNDSGPMHLAWMQRVPVVALFGPTVREHGFFPRGEAARVLEAPVVPDCRPCGLHGRKTCPRGDHACMTGIDPDTVWQAVRQRLFG